jgi:hypothetical protein
MPRWNFLNTRNRIEEEIRPAVTTTRSWLAADNTDNASEIHWNWPNTDNIHLDWHYSNNTNEMLNNAYNHMTARDVMEMAEEASPERMLRLVRLAMPNITRNTLVEETPMEVLEDSDYARWTSLYSTNWGNTYNYKDSYNGRKIVYKNGKFKIIKRCCKI